MTNTKECKFDDPQWQQIEEQLKPGYITKNFSFQELTHSQTASRRGIDNTPTNQHKLNLIESTKNLWQPLRDALGVPIQVTSGYRSFALNKIIGGSLSSAHSVGYAIDMNIPSLGTTKEQAETVLKALKEHNLPFDQMILEFYNPNDKYSGWIHLGYANRKNESRRQVLTAIKRKGKTIYLEGLV